VGEKEGGKARAREREREREKARESARESKSERERERRFDEKVHLFSGAHQKSASVFGERHVTSISRSHGPR
jgi:hypothetical protein